MGAHDLKSYTLADFDAVARAGSAGFRHAVGHGAAAAETYSWCAPLFRPCLPWISWLVTPQYLRPETSGPLAHRGQARRIARHRLDG